MSQNFQLPQIFLQVMTKKKKFQRNKKELLHPKPRVSPQFVLANTIIRNKAWQAAQLGRQILLVFVSE